MAETPKRAGLLELFYVFAKISALTIGGGYVMFPLMIREVAETRKWLTEEELVDYFALGQSVPGIIAMNTATLVGYRKRGIPGAVFAAAGMAAPSLVVILLIAAFLTPCFDHPAVKKAFAGIRAAVVAMLLMAVWQVGKKSINTVSKGVIAAVSCIAIVGFQLNPVLMICAGALLGFLLFKKEAENG